MSVSFRRREQKTHPVHEIRENTLHLLRVEVDTCSSRVVLPERVDRYSRWLALKDPTANVALAKPHDSRSGGKPTQPSSAPEQDRKSVV